MKQRCKGFTLVELLVVIGIIALLISILIPTLGKARNQAQRIKCQANLQQIGQVWHMYANENDGWFPILFEERLNSSGAKVRYSNGNWALLFADNRPLKVDYRSMMKDRYKMPSGNIFYCPNYRSYTGSDTNSDWSYTRTDTSSGLPPDYYTVPVSYSFYAGNASAETYSKVLRNNVPPPFKASDKRLAERPIAFDETNYYAPPYNAWITYGFSNHFEKAPYPAGGNALFGDGHAEWRGWKQMIKVVDAGAFRRYF